MSVRPADDRRRAPEAWLFSTAYRLGVLANAIGGALAFVYLSFLSPPQPPPPEGEGFLFLGVAPLYFAATAALMYLVGRRRFRPVERWMAERREPDDAERRLVLALPWRAAAGAALAWTGAALLFGVITATHHPLVFVAGVVVGIVLAGLISTAVTFLLNERAMRPVFASAFAGEVPAGGAQRVLRTRPRLLVSWALGSGIALLAIPLAFVGRAESTGHDLLPPVVFLVLAGLFAGAVSTSAAARAISEPLERLRTALQRVEAGSLGERVTVDDGGEIGMLQAGFNRMVEGLRERERIREAFGTYLDRDVADHILREGPSLEGEEVEVTVLFLDVRGFTGLAERLSAPDVVATLNRLFERAVPIVHDHGGHVDKYVGDGFLAVFGAPRRQPDHADQALAAALEVAAAVASEFGTELHVGIGLNSGTVVAGNVGGGGRLEFSVIGDVVNVAARVESATRQTDDAVLITTATRARLRPGLVDLQERPGMTLKGKHGEATLYAPVAAVPGGG